MVGCLLPCFSCCITTSKGPGFYKQNPDLLTLEQYRYKYAEALKSKQFFHGSKPGVVDVSLCGVIVLFEEAGNTCVAAEVVSEKAICAMKQERPQLV